MNLLFVGGVVQGGGLGHSLTLHTTLRKTVSPKDRVVSLAAGLLCGTFCPLKGDEPKDGNKLWFPLDSNDVSRIVERSFQKPDGEQSIENYVLKEAIFGSVPGDLRPVYYPACYP